MQCCRLSVINNIKKEVAVPTFLLHATSKPEYSLMLYNSHKIEAPEELVKSVRHKDIGFLKKFLNQEQVNKIFGGYYAPAKN